MIRVAVSPYVNLSGHPLWTLPADDWTTIQYHYIINAEQLPEGM